jgi:signal peptidase I
VLGGIALLIAAMVVALPFAVGAFAIRAFRTPSSSMCPTICLDERFLASMNAYATQPPARGEVILHSAADGKTLFTKRVIGIAGDVVSPGAHNALVINGHPLDQPKVCGRPPTDDTSASENSPFKTVKVPPNHLFVVGDNLSNSYDSRHYGVIALDQVKGKPLFLYWSSGNSRIGCRIR